MIDTLMAFWNQDRRKRARQALLTFFLMCISISLLFVVMGLPQWSHKQPQGNGTGRAGGTGGTATTQPTVIVQVTQVTTAIPTSTITVPRQFTRTPSSNPSTCSSPQAQMKAAFYRNTITQQATPNIPTSQHPIVYTNATPTHGTQRTAHETPTPSLSPSPTIVPTIVTATTPTPSMVPTGTTSHGTPPHKPGQLQGGGPINTGTPISASPVPTPISTGGTQHIGGGWTSACNSNDIGAVTGPYMVSFLWQNLWSILGASLICTVLFYGVIWSICRRRMVKRDK